MLNSVTLGISRHDPRCRRRPCADWRGGERWRCACVAGGPKMVVRAQDYLRNEATAGVLDYEEPILRD